MRKRRLTAMLLALCLACTCMVMPALAADTYTVAEVPVTLTVINSLQKISVTCPASLPVAVVDGYVVTATTAAITNTASSGTVQVSAVNIQATGGFTIGDYEDFDEDPPAIALSINGCVTEGAGGLDLNDDAFPELEAGESLPLEYSAKVCLDEEEDELDAVTAAYLVFTLEAV